MFTRFDYKILAFDPGLSTAGWNVSIFNTTDNILHVTDFGMLLPNKDINTKDSHLSYVKYGPRIVTLSELRRQVDILVDRYKPHLIVSEDAFYNFKRPSAYSALIQWLTTVDMLLKDKYSKVLFKLAPKVAKQVVAGFGGAEKHGVQYAVLHRDDIDIQVVDAESKLTEHICDSIGIAYAFATGVLPALIDIWESNYGEEKKADSPETHLRLQFS